MIAVLTIYGALARRFQGLSDKEMPLKRSWRMLVWVPLAFGLMELGIEWGWSWWAGLLLGSLPGFWQWLPGDWNTFAVKKLVNIHTAYTEMIAGAFGVLVVLALMAQPVKAFWIEKNPKYVSPLKPTVHCSGREHCAQVPGRVVFSVIEGKPRWSVKGMRGSFPSEQVYWVPGLKQPWACMWNGDNHTMTGGDLACLFLRDAGN